jgi:hypothetical protein
LKVSLIYFSKFPSFSNIQSCSPNKCFSVFETNISRWLRMLLIILLSLKKQICRRSVSENRHESIMWWNTNKEKIHFVGSSGRSQIQGIFWAKMKKSTSVSG